MPGMDGYEVCTRLKASAATTRYPGHLSDRPDGDQRRNQGLRRPGRWTTSTSRSRPRWWPREFRLTWRCARRADNWRGSWRPSATNWRRRGTSSYRFFRRTCHRFAGLDIAANYIPMTSVAGDFYDFAVIDDHTVGVLVADVSGHGMPAALIASMLKIAFAAQSGHAGDPVKRIVGLEPGLVRQVPGPLCDRGLRRDRHRQARRSRTRAPDTRRCCCAMRRRERFAKYLENGLFLGLLSECRVHRRRSSFPQGRLAAALHGWNPRDDERGRGAIRRSSP